MRDCFYPNPCRSFGVSSQKPAVLNNYHVWGERMPRDTKSIFMAILSGDKEEETAIAEVVRSFHAEFAVAPTMRHMRDLLFEQLCNGLLLCIPSLVGIDQTSKSFVQTLEHIYPVARIRWSQTDGSFALIASRTGRVETFEDFFAVCSNFAPRRLRRCERLAKTLNVLISSDPDLGNASRAFTTDIALRGCFLHTPQEWKAGDTVYLQIQELSTHGAIEGKVVRYIPWGVPFRVQGIGVQFVNLTSKQSEDLQHLLYFLPVGLAE
jgi:Tfp pilus assembly protein PilZ